MNETVIRVSAILLAAAPLADAVDQNNNQQSDVWEMLFQATNLPATGDFDADGWSNAVENSAGTDPKSATSHPGLDMALVTKMPTFRWMSYMGKHYTLLSSSNLTSFAPTEDVATGTGGEMTFQLPPADGQKFFRMAVNDRDSDGDDYIQRLNQPVKIIWSHSMDTSGIEPKDFR